MASHGGPHKNTTLETLCKRNNVFFQQQLVAMRMHRPRLTFEAPQQRTDRMLATPVRITGSITPWAVVLCAFVAVAVETSHPLGAESPAPVTRSEIDSSFEATAALDVMEVELPPAAIEVEPFDHDRLWLVSTRHLSPYVCRANVDDPSFRWYRLDRCGRTEPTDLLNYIATRNTTRPTVIYVHGNRMDSCDAIERGLFVYQQSTRCARVEGPIDWVIWSWPADRRGLLVADAREKARRTEAQGLYLATLLRQHVELGQPTAIIGYSFGARVITGSLHALAGGALLGRRLAGPPVMGANFDVGLIAPALQTDWLSQRGYHRLATQNMDRLTLFFNPRDRALKNYWRIDRMRNATALGFTGPRVFAPRYDGTPLPVQSRNCGAFLGFRHDEEDYYAKPCMAGRQMGLLIDSSLVRDE